MKKYIVILLVIISVGVLLGCTIFEKGSVKDIKSDAKYTMPMEDSKHEGTWLQWPHQFTYGKKYKKEIEPIWIEMTKALTMGEKVHIIAYDKLDEEDIKNILIKNGVNMNQVDFTICKTDDVWARDSGPIFAYDKNNKLNILDFGFNGWGKKVVYKNDEKIRENISKKTGINRVDLKNVVLEGGAFELDGNGTFLATKSSILNKNRNPNLSQKEFEKIISENLGVTNFIWLNGVKGIDITDFHIDGFAKFYNSSTIITMDKNDLSEWGLSNKDINTLLTAKDAKGGKYHYIYLPLTQNNIILKNGKNLEYKGSYLNYYVANDVVLVPNYNDPNDKVANAEIQKLYPAKKVIGIDIRELYKDGGMIHCVTQQQPVAAQ